MDRIGTELGQRANALEQFVRPRKRGAARAIDDPDEVQRLACGIDGEGPAPLAQVGKTAR